MGPLPLAAALWSGIAPAGAEGATPAVRPMAEGFCASVVVDSTPEQVRAALADPADMALRPPDMISVEATPRAGCHEIEGRTRGLLRPLAYRSLRCPTPTGFLETLVASEDFERYEAEWRIEAVEGGTRVSFRIDVLPDLPVPRALVSENVKRSAVAVVTALRDRLAGR